MPTIQHSNLGNAELHEPKGVSSASADQVYVSDGAGSGDWKTPWASWWWNVDHSGGSVALTSGAKTDITNDDAGSASLDFNKLPGTTDIWDTSTNSFDWAAGGLELGDSVVIRLDIDLTVNSNNDGFLIEIDLAHGHASEFSLPLREVNIDTAGTHQLVFVFTVFMGNTNVLNEPAKLTITADSAGDSYELNGFWVKAEPTNPRYI